MKPKTDLYKVLGLKRNASDQEVKKRIRGLKLKYHPDRNDGDDTKFKEVSAAGDVLGDPAKRKQYDETGEIPISQSGDYYGDVLPMLSEMFQALTEDFCKRMKPESIKTVDVRIGLGKTIDLNIQQSEQGISGNEKAMIVTKELAGRFTSDGGVIEGLLKNQLVLLQEGIDYHREKLRRLNKLKVLVATSNFDWVRQLDESPRVPTDADVYAYRFADFSAFFSR